MGSYQTLPLKAFRRVSISSQEFTSYASASVAKKDYNLVSVPTVTEHILFLWVLVCKFIFSPAGGKPTMEYHHTLARSLAIGPSFALAWYLVAWLNLSRPQEMCH